MIKLKLLISGLVLISSYCLAQTENQARQLEITSLVHSFLQQQLVSTDQQRIEIEVKALDRRKKIKPCPQPLVISLPGKTRLSRNTTVEVNCPQQWKIYVPARIRRLQPVVVSVQSLSPGTLLTQANLTIAYKDTLTLRGSTISDIDSVIGSKTKRHLQRQQPIIANNICLVCRGDPVTIYARSGNLTIKSIGKALKDGSIGQTIAVKNSSSGRRIEALVVAVGEVEIKL